MYLRFHTRARIASGEYVNLIWPRAINSLWKANEEPLSLVIMAWHPKIQVRKGSKALLSTAHSTYVVQICALTEWVSQSYRSKYIHICCQGPVANIPSAKDKQIEKASAQCCSLVTLYSSQLHPANPAQAPTVMLQLYSEGKEMLALKDDSLQKNGIKTKVEMHFYIKTLEIFPYWFNRALQQVHQGFGELGTHHLINHVHVKKTSKIHFGIIFRCLARK